MRKRCRKCGILFIGSVCPNCNIEVEVSEAVNKFERKQIKIEIEQIKGEEVDEDE